MTKIYAVISKNEESGVPLIRSEIYMTRTAAENAYKKQIQELCNYDPDCPIDESELDNIECISVGPITVIDACCDTDNLITLYLVSIKIKEEN